MILFSQAAIFVLKPSVYKTDAQCLRLSDAKVHLHLQIK